MTPVPGASDTRAGLSKHCVHAEHRQANPHTHRIKMWEWNLSLDLSTSGEVRKELRSHGQTHALGPIISLNLHIQEENI